MGPIQIGIPAETIKTSLLKGEDVPQVYCLPPKLFSAEQNLAEIEFPLYFNFFIKKAFLNPEKKIILIGDTTYIQNVKQLFKESFHGPDPEFIFTEEEISPEKKATGYWYFENYTFENCFEFCFL